jgi:Fic family protein
MQPDEFSEQAPGELVPVSISSLDPIKRTPVNVDTFAFVPNPLPVDLPLSDELVLELELAAHALGSLDGLGRHLTNPALLIQPYLRREAVASSKIEGTIADYEQLVLFEEANLTSPEGPDVGEVLNYVRTLNYGLYRPEGRRISTALLREMHTILMASVRGSNRNPGQFRTKQVYIGRPGAAVAQARFVPPPAHEVPALMMDLERSIDQQTRLPRLVRAAMLHYQFETIHPFEDGNGRIGRVLIPLLFQDWGLLAQPILYLSPFFEEHRRTYYDLLLSVSQTGDWESWISFFVAGVRSQAQDAHARAGALLELRERYRQRFGSGAPVRTLEIIEHLFESPVLTSAQLTSRYDIPQSSAQSAIRFLEREGVLRETTGRRRDRVYLAEEISTIISKQQDPI